MKKKNYRHGDVIIKSAAIPQGAKKKEGQTLAFGEVTGHAHRIVSGAVEMMGFEDQVYLRVFSDIAEVNHEEHGLKTLVRGDYTIQIRQEWKEDGWTKVQD